MWSEHSSSRGQRRVHLGPVNVHSDSHAARRRRSRARRPGHRPGPQRQGHRLGDAEISAASARVRTLVITAREDIEVARQVRTALGLAAAEPDPRP
jgi:hypothetical protein